MIRYQRLESWLALLIYRVEPIILTCLPQKLTWDPSGSDKFMKMYTGFFRNLFSRLPARDRL